MSVLISVRLACCLLLPGSGFALGLALVSVFSDALYSGYVLTCRAIWIGVSLCRPCSVCVDACDELVFWLAPQ